MFITDIVENLSLVEDSFDLFLDDGFFFLSSFFFLFSEDIELAEMASFVSSSSSLLLLEFFFFFFVFFVSILLNGVILSGRSGFGLLPLPSDCQFLCIVYPFRDTAERDFIGLFSDLECIFLPKSADGEELPTSGDPEFLLDTGSSRIDAVMVDANVTGGSIALPQVEIEMSLLQSESSSDETTSSKKSSSEIDPERERRLGRFCWTTIFLPFL